MSTSENPEEANLDRLLKVFHSDKYNKRRKLLNSSENDKETASNIDLLKDSDLDEEEEEEGVNSLELTENLLEKDMYNSYNEDFETYLNYNKQDETELLFKHPLFVSYKRKYNTPLVKYLSNLQDVPNPVENMTKYYISKSFLKRIQNLFKENKSVTKEKKTKVIRLSSNVKYLFSCLNTYVDIFYVNNRVSVLKSVRFVYSLHIANHIVKSSLKRKESKEDDRFEGFTRPKVLVICGLRCIASEIVHNILNLLPCSKSNKNLERFENDFSLGQEDLEQQKESFLKTKKSSDFVKTFSGNQDDAFKIGLRYESGLLHLYSPFYSSDVVIASPLGLRPLITSKDPDYDFLSSIEIVVVDRLDIIKFQNWRLFIDLFKVINKPLVKWRDGDINKIRMSTIDGQCEEYRQNILISCTRNVVFNSFFKNMKNRRGGMRLFTLNNKDYVLLVSKFNIQQMFIKVPCNDIKQSQDDCLEYFMENMLSNLEEINGVLLVLSDYTQYYKLSKKLKLSNLEYVSCLESNTPKQMKLARQQFHSNSVPILVTTFRLLFFKRYLFKGSSKIFLIEPPEYPQLYKDFIRMVDLNRSNSIVCHYTKYHAMLLESIVGSHRINKLIDAPDTKISQFH